MPREDARMNINTDEVARIIKHDWVKFDKLSYPMTDKESSFYEGMTTAESHFKTKIRDLAKYFDEQEHLFNKKEFLHLCGVIE